MTERSPASFRDVPFFVDTADAVFGRRVVSHEYPYRDTPWVDDLGRKQRVFTLSAFLLSDDIANARAALIEALEQAGSGILVHPRFGQLRVQIGDVTWRSSSRTDREDFTIECLEPGNQSQTQNNTNTLASVNAAVNRNLAVHSQVFSEQLSVLSNIQFVVDDAKELVTAGLESLRNINGAIQGAIAPVSDIAFGISSIGNEINSLLRTPQQLASAIVGVMVQTFALVDDVDRAISSYNDIVSAWDDVEPIANASQAAVITRPHLASIASSNTVTRQQQQKNRDAIIHLFNRAALVATVSTVSKQAAGINISNADQSPFTSFNHAIDVRDTLIAAVDNELLEADYDSYSELAQLQSQFHQHIAAHGVSLPRINNLPIKQLQPSLVLAYRLYGDANRASDITARNSLRHPLFIDADKTLEVASA